MAIKLDKLAEDGIISQQVLDRLKQAWISNADELYARIQTAEFSQEPEIRRKIAYELGISEYEIDRFKKSLEFYISPETLNTKKTKRISSWIKIKRQTGSFKFFIFMYL